MGGSLDLNLGPPALIAAVGAAASKLYAEATAAQAPAGHRPPPFALASCGRGEFRTAGDEASIPLAPAMVGTRCDRACRAGGGGDAEDCDRGHAASRRPPDASGESPSPWKGASA